MADSTTTDVNLPALVKATYELAAQYDAAGLDTQAYKLRSIAVAGERTFRRNATAAKRANGETMPGRPPTKGK